MIQFFKTIISSIKYHRMYVPYPQCFIFYFFIKNKIWGDIQLVPSQFCPSVSIKFFIFRIDLQSIRNTNIKN
jgi:hypothetical protein